MKYLIGFAGKKRSGKDTAAGFLSEALPAEHIVRLSFALPLKRWVADMFHISLETLEQQKARYRKALQFLGEFARELWGDDYWIRKLNIELNKCGEGDVVIITDVRYKNEAEYIRALGGVVVRINRVTSRIDHPDYGTGTDKHASETALDYYEHYFKTINALSLQDLKQQIETLAHELIQTKHSSSR